MANTKVTSAVIADNAVGIDQLNVSDGTNGQVLTTNGSGTLSFSTISGYTDSDVETYLDTGTSTPTFSSATVTSTINIDSAASAGLIVDRASTSYGSTVDFKTGGTLKWYMGLRGLGNDNFYVRNEVGSTDALTIITSGNVGIKSTSPDYSLSVAGLIEAEGATELGGSNAGACFLHYSTNNYSYFQGAYGANGVFFSEATGSTRVGMQSGQVMTFETNAAERMRIGSDGVLLVNRTSRFGAGSTDAMIVTGKSDAAIRVTGSNTSGYKWVEFYNGSLNQIGSISNNSNTNTSFNTSSDYRLKENINDVWDATTILKQLRPVEFTWIADETNGVHQGFIAHEVATAVPNAVTGEKDAMTAAVLYEETDQEVIDGEAQVGDIKEEEKINPQQLDHSKLVPLLVKTIQELEARITELENA